MPTFCLALREEVPGRITVALGAGGWLWDRLQISPAVWAVFFFFAFSRGFLLIVVLSRSWGGLVMFVPDLE